MKGFILRKIIHIDSVIFPFAILIFDKKIYLPIIAFFFGAFLTAEFFRFEIKSFRLFFKEFFGGLIKHPENKKFTGATWVCFSAFFIALFFDKYIASFSMFLLCLSDPISALVGKFAGKHKIYKNKTLEGSIVFFIVSILISYFFPLFDMKIKITVSLIVTLVELFSGEDLDDNLIIPFSSAFLLTILV